MGADSTAETERVARRYFEAWTAQDTKAVAETLAEDFQFAAGDMTIEGSNAFLNAGAFPQEASTTLVAEAYQGDVGFQMYDAVRGERTVRIVELLSVRDGQLASSTFVTDMAAFMSLMAG